MTYRERHPPLLLERELGPIQQLHRLQRVVPSRRSRGGTDHHNLLHRLHRQPGGPPVRRLHLLEVQVSRKRAQKMRWRSWISLKKTKWRDHCSTYFTEPDQAFPCFIADFRPKSVNIWQVRGVEACLASGRHMEELDLAVQIMRRSNLPLKGRSLPLDTAEENNKKIVPGTVQEHSHHTLRLCVRPAPFYNH